MLSLLPGIVGMLTDSLERERVGLQRPGHKSDFGRNIPGGGSGISSHTFLKTTPGLLIITALMLEQTNSLAATDLTGDIPGSRRVWISQD